MSKPELHKSKTINGYRVRFLRKKEDDRWDFHGLERSEDTQAAYDYIYTEEEAMFLGIKFRNSWQTLKPDTEKYYFSDTSDSYGQQDDWVKTEYEHAGHYWVMRVLWRNDNPSFPHIKTATGTYPIGGLKKFDGSDQDTQYRASTDRAYSNENHSLSPREKLLVTFIVQLIIKHGYYSKDIVKLAYNSAYKNSPSWQKVVLLMQSAKIMGKVVEELKNHLKSEKLETDWVLRQLKDMGENDHDKDPNRRLDVVKLVGAMNQLPMYPENQHKMVYNNNRPLPIEAEEIEAEDDLKQLG
jgi:hypothetical protein